MGLVDAKIRASDKDLPVTTSPDENSTPKKSSSSKEEDSSYETTPAKVLSGIFETFDNYLRCGTTQMQTQPYLNIQVQIMLFAIIFKNGVF